jgi:hypothetical protein
VRVIHPYDAGLLAERASPLILHDSKITRGWLPVGTTVNAAAHTAPATIGSFGVVDVIDDATSCAEVGVGLERRNSALHHRGVVEVGMAVEQLAVRAEAVDDRAAAQRVGAQLRLAQDVERRDVAVVST